MSRMHPEADPRDSSIPGDVLVRQDPDEDDEEEDQGNGKDDEYDDEENEDGYSE